MKRSASCGILALGLCFFLNEACILQSETPSADTAKIAAAQADELKFVVIVSRHGVRSPTSKTDVLNPFSRQPWPTWSVPPGYLTEHGARLMTLFGAYDRELLASEGLLAANGCADAEHIRIVADSDQRTRETGKALAAGIAPGCAVSVSALAEGTNDPLFHPQGPMRAQADKQLATAAVSGRIGANPLGLVEAYRPQLNALEAVLQSCAPGVNCVAAAPLKSLFDLPSSIAPGKDRQIVDLRTPLGPAATMAENMLLEYAEGMDAANVGWGQVDLNKLRELVQLHTAHVDVAQRVPYIARMQSSNMLAHVLESMQQAVGKKPVAGALSKQDDRLLVLSGHDTNVAAIAASLGLSWVVDGRRDDTPPGGALVFELWKRRGAESYSVRTYYQAQTLDQMRNATPLTLANPPERLPVFVPGCGEADGSCGWDGFQHTVGAAIDSTFVK